MTMIERMQELERRVGAVENERARNITTLVESFAELQSAHHALVQHVRSLEGDVKHAAAAGAVEARLRDIERRMPAPIEVVTPLAFPLSEPSLVNTSGPSCYTCNGPVEPERHDYVHPTCYRCLPPPEPLPVRAVAPNNLALPDYILAPAPDYRSDLPADEACYECGTKHGPDENTQCPLSSVYAGPSIQDPCGCEESESLRAELRQLAAECDRLRAAVPFPDDPDRVATLAVKLASETESYQRALKAEYAKREAVESELSDALQALDLLRSLDNVRRAVAYLDRAEAAESECADLRDQLQEARNEVRHYSAEVERLRTAVDRANRIGDKYTEMYRAAESRLAAANALLVRIKHEGVTLELRKRLVEYCGIDDAHLSAQPAAPVCGCCWCSDGHPEQCCSQPAASVFSKARASSGGPCPCGDQERPGHPVGWCAEQDAKRQPPPTDHERAALLEAMGRDMDRCRAGLKPEHAIDPRLDRYAERLAERVVGGISGKPEST